MRVYIDIESFSEKDIKKVGMFAYAEDHSTEIICIRARTATTPFVRWNEGAPLPEQFHRWAADPNTIWVAHNAGFELTMLNGNPGQKIGFPKTSIHTWLDTAAKCRFHSIPGSLEGAGEALALPVQKDKEGHAIMLKLCRPRRASRANSHNRWLPSDKPEEFARFYQYCETDVDTTIGVDQALFDMPESERLVWVLDYAINARGYRIDVAATNAIVDIRGRVIEEADRECMQITGGLTSSKRNEMVLWCNAMGADLPDYTKATVLTALRTGVPEDVRRALEIRQSVGKVSTKKYASLARGVCHDGRLRGTLMYYGAGTGRWSGKIFQPHNLAQGTVKDMVMDVAVQDLLTLTLSQIRYIYGDPMELISSCIRGMIIPDDGKELVVCDFSSIEARVVQWLAGDDDALGVFRTGKDNYRVMAAEIYHLAYEQIAKGSKERQVGKQAILGLGYAMGWVKFLSTCLQRNLDVDEALSRRVVDAFRRKYARLKDFWYSMNDAAIAAIENPGKPFSAGGAGLIEFISTGDWLRMALPSGRMLSYYRPTVEPKQVDTGEYKFWAKQIRYWGVDTETRRYTHTKTYGGKLVENATQAVARDILVCGMHNLAKAGHPVVLHVHDEAVAETPIGTLSVQEMERLMCDMPAWAKGLPIKAEGFVCQRYRK